MENTENNLGTESEGIESLVNDTRREEGDVGNPVTLEPIVSVVVRVFVVVVVVEFRLFFFPEGLDSAMADLLPVEEREPLELVSVTFRLSVETVTCNREGTSSA